jgi:DNA polymerase-3 subunit delta'
VSWLGIHGHDAIRDAFAHADERGRLGHSYLFSGPEGIGKKRFALALAQAISCLKPKAGLNPCDECSACIQIKAGTYPDLHVVGLPEDKHEFPIALMQELIKSLGLKPSHQGSRRIAIVDDADALNEESANCFLKTLEEPPPDSLLILIGTAPERQLPTILSRCQVIRFQALNNSDLVKAAVEVGIVGSKVEAEKSVALAHGSLSRLKLMLDPDIQAFATALHRTFQTPKFESVALGILLTKFADAAKESAQKRIRAQFAVELLLALFRTALQHAETEQPELQAEPAIARLAKHPSPQALLSMIDVTLEAEQQIDRRFQLALILEALADRLGQILR